MDLYQEKIQLRYHSVDEAITLQDKKAEAIARELIKCGVAIEIISQSTGLSTKKVQQIAKRHNTKK